MNITEAEYEQMKAAYALPTNESIMQMIFGASESFYCFDTYQSKDYSRVRRTESTFRKKPNDEKRYSPRIGKQHLNWASDWPNQ